MGELRKWQHWLRQNSLGPDIDILRAWLRGVLANLEADPADALTRVWLYGEPEPGSDWTRDQELARWIAVSDRDPVAWEGCRRLLDRTGSPERPIPPALLLWGIDVARRRRRQPKRPHGQHATDNRWRDPRIALAVLACRNTGCTLQTACDEVAVVVGMESDNIEAIYKRVRRRDGLIEGLFLKQVI